MAQRAFRLGIQGELIDYHEDLGNPPLLVVCDFDRYEVHTKWTNQESWTYRFRNADVAGDDPVEVLGSGGAKIKELPQFTANPDPQGANDPKVEAVSRAAAALTSQRDHRLAGSKDNAGERPATMTGIYNANEPWLVEAHRAIDLGIVKK